MASVLARNVLLLSLLLVFSLKVVHSYAFLIDTSSRVRRTKLPLQLSSSSSSSSSSCDPNIIQVFDNVFTSKTCQEILHPLAVEHAERCVSSVFYRNTSTDGTTTTSPSTADTAGHPLTPLEVVLDRLLTAIHIDNDDVLSNNSIHPNIVEYWTRQDYLHMDMHCDIDERELEQQGSLRYPSYSHVLYLKISCPSPTCVLSGNSMTPNEISKHDPFCNVETSNQNNVLMHDTNSEKAVLMTTVPAVQGRLLRFPGHLFHTVPKPYDRWILSLEEASNVNQGGGDNDNEDDDDDTEVRSVILFNTWEDHGPLEVGPDILKTCIPVGIEMDEDMLAYLEQERLNRISDWQAEYGGVNFEELICQPREEWIERRIVSTQANSNTNTTATSEILLNLMGKEKRHLHSKQRIALSGSASALRAALEQDRLVSALKWQLSN